jgi:hypothetical protein
MTKTLEAVPTTTAPANGSTPKRRILKRSEILTKRVPKHEDVPTDEWGEGTAVRVRKMDFDTKDLWELAQVAFIDDKNGESMRGLRAKIVARCIIDEDDKPQFTDADVEELAKQDATPIKRIWAAIQRISKDDKLDVEIEKAAGNS